ncbi:MAG: beta-ketoacyl-ACP synthase II [Deltaproteobacteria bacterium]|nr:beta-ketoacyl-ACP synthase II [Deltaproteobacteria bacterium]
MKENKRERRAVITGLGIIAPNGIGRKAFWNALKEGKSGIVKITRFDASTYSTQIAGEVSNFEPTDFMSPKSARRLDRFTQFGVAASRMAIGDAQLDIDGNNNKKIGISIGSSLGALPYAEFQHAIFLEKGLNRTDPLLATRLFPGEASSYMSIELGIKGPCYTFSTGCVAGTDAIGYALTLIRNNVSDVVITGGTEAPLAPLSFGAFCRIGALSQRNGDPTKACSPFDKKRDGFVMSEGAGMLVLEELEHALKRDAHIYAELSGFGATSEAYHMTKPLEDAEGTIESLKIALRDADVNIEEIDYINAHGTSTPLNDKTETLAIKKVFGPRAYKIPISSTKSMTGHTIAGAGAIEAVASALMIENQFIHPTINYETPDPECDLNYVPNKGIKADVQVILSNSLGFGSRNATVIIKKY